MPLIMNTVQTNNYEHSFRIIIRPISSNVTMTIALCHNATVDGSHKRNFISAMSCYSARSGN